LKKQLTTTLPYSGASAGAQLGAITDIGNTVLSNFYVGQLAGVQIFESALVASDTTGGATAYKNGVFSMNSIGHAMRGGIDMNTLYLPAARATDVVLKAVAGAGTLQSTFGVRITAEGTIN
jgi:hypothetical protein